MAGFNPDKFLAETAQNSGEFDPDKFLSETSQPEPSAGSKLAHGALQAVDAVAKIVDLPTAPVRGAIGKMVGTQTQGYTPWTAPTSQEIIETAVPATAKTITLEPQGPGGIPIQTFMTPDEQDLARSQSQMKPSVALGMGADLALGYGVGKVASLAGQALKVPVSKAAEALGSAAENLAVNSTGATGVQSSKFADDAGRKLLDKKLVRFGDSSKNIANRISAANEEAGRSIDQVLKALDAKGVTASADNVVEALQNHVAKLRRDPSQAGTVRKIEGIIEDIKATGEAQVPISEGETTKRGFSKAAGNWMDPEAGKAGKQAYLAYKDEVEKAATAADPTLAKKFTDSKESYGLLAPIQEAAERRALTVRQSPYGGLGDYAAIGAGGAAGGPLGAAASLVGKKVVAPRFASSAAVTLDSISKGLKASPEMLKLADANPAAYQAIAKNLNDNFASGQGSVLRPAADSKESAPKKGPDRWANDGFEKLIEHSSDLKDKRDIIFADPKLKELLIQASDLKPGTKAMEDIKTKIKSRVSKVQD